MVVQYRGDMPKPTDKWPTAQNMGSGAEIAETEQEIEDSRNRKHSVGIDDN